MGAAGGELDALIGQYPAEVNLQRLSRDFGTPHPVMAQNYACELLNMQPFPAFGGNSSRLLGESWDSTNLYWARLADEKGYSPVMLNRLVPELTRHMVANIFATDIEDWLALMRAMKETGEEFRQGKIVLPQVTEAASSNQEAGVLPEQSPAASAPGGPQINGIQDKQWQSDIYSSIPICSCVSFLGGRLTGAQDDSTNIRVNVDLVQLNVAVTDSKGNYISGLGPENFAITEDKIPERIATFEEGNEPARQVFSQRRTRLPAQPVAPGPLGRESKTATVVNAMPPRKPIPPGVGEDASTLPAQVAGANVFVLFDTSNYMYRGFVFAQDAITDFVRSLESANKVAFYSYSRDLSRNSALTSDRAQVLRGVRSTVAGDDAALYNCLLLTVEDAARYTGRKVVVVFSNGPDNASLVPPEDVAELAQSTGTIIYMISTREAQLEPISTAVFERMSKATGGKAYFARSWSDEKKAFAFIQEDLAHLYSLSYYPQPNPSAGWRAITVKLVGKDLQKYHVRTRAGYRLQQAHAAANNSAELEAERSVGVSKVAKTAQESEARASAPYWL